MTVDLGTIITGGPINWSTFYSGMYPQAAIDQKRALSSDSAKADKFSFQTLQNLFGPETTMPGKTNDGGASDFFEQPNPGASSASGGEVAAGNAMFDLGALIPRFAIIILGFVFVAAGLALFKDNPVVQMIK